jgi:hypothetical protein
MAYNEGLGLVSTVAGVGTEGSCAGSFGAVDFLDSDGLRSAGCLWEAVGTNGAAGTAGARGEPHQWLRERRRRQDLSYGPPWAHYLGGYQDRLLDGPLGLLDLGHTAPDGVERKDLGGEVLG